MNRIRISRTTIQPGTARNEWCSFQSPPKGRRQYRSSGVVEGIAAERVAPASAFHLLHLRAARRRVGVQESLHEAGQKFTATAGAAKRTVGEDDVRVGGVHFAELFQRG